MSKGAGVNPDPEASTETGTSDALLREALSFLGHNAREGHSSTLALLELQRIKTDPLGMAELVERVERNARKSLAAIDDFMDLNAARTQALRVEDIDLADLLVEVVADAWSLASRHGIRVLITSAIDNAPARADRELLAGALAKLLRDVAARTPRGVDVHCALIAAPGEWIVEVEDPGAPSAMTAAAERSPWDSKLPPEDRPGPGLALAQVVAQRHGGWMAVEQGLSQGRILRFGLPRV